MLTLFGQDRYAFPPGLKVSCREIVESNRVDCRKQRAEDYLEHKLHFTISYNDAKSPCKLTSVFRCSGI